MKNNKDRLIDAIGGIDDKYIKEADETKRSVFSFNWAFVGKLLTGALCLLLLVNIIPRFFMKGGASNGKDENVSEDSYAYSTQNSTVDDGGVYDIEYGYETKDELNNNKKLIVTGNINIETLDFDKLIEELNNNVEQADGYIQNSSINVNRYDSRFYEATIRIPADKYNDFLDKTKQRGNVTWYNESIDDISETYTDLEARLNSLKAEEAKVIEFYDKASNLEELLTIEQRLTDIRYEIDSIETRISNYDTLVAYSTLIISVTETKTYTKTNDNFSSRLGLSFRNGLTNFINTFQNFMIDIAYNFWSIVVTVVVIIGAVKIIKIINKKNKKDM